MAGRYTAQHLYGTQPYQVANSGATMPYTTSAYGCPHSQRQYLFQFESYQERTQFDAANTSCCNQLVTPFYYKPQYAEQAYPPRVSDCTKPVTGCNVLEVDDYGVSPCASLAGAGNHVGIKIRCPQVCQDIVDTMAGKQIEGQHGYFEYAGQPAPDVYELRYVLDADVLQQAWNNCAGVSWQEMLCREVPIPIAIGAGVLKPGGCDCDCCGNIGVGYDLITPACDTVSGGYANHVDCSDAWWLTGGCSGQGEAMDLYISGDLYAGWVAGPSPAVYGSWWGLSGIPGYVGDADHPACCGLSGEVEWDRGCGSDFGTSSVTLSTKKPTSYTAIWAQFQELRWYYWSGGWSGGVSDNPDDGPCSGNNACRMITMPYTSASERFISGYQACAWSNKTALDISGWTGLEMTYGDMERGSGKVYRSLGKLVWETERDSQCCGFGRMMVDFNNGCDDLDKEPVYVRHPETEGANEIVVGHALKCTSGSVWMIEEATLYCDGSTGTFWSGVMAPAIPIPTSLEECNAVIMLGGGVNPFLDYGHYLQKGCRTGEDSQCCFVSRSHVASGEDYRVYVWQGGGTDKCCPNIPRAMGYYVREATDCCPVKTGDPWI